MLRTCIVVLAVALAAACGSSSPAGPTPSSPVSASAVQAPRITSMTPGELTQAGTEQTVTIAGENFQSGISATLTGPDGVAATADSAAIGEVGPGSFTLRHRFANSGRYTLRLANRSGRTSDAWTFAVAAAPVEVPRISGRCASPAPLRGYFDPRAPGYIVTFADGTDVDRALAMLQDHYGFTPTHVYRSALLGFSALLSAEAVEGIRCEPVVKSVAYNASVTIG